LSQRAVFRFSIRRRLIRRAMQKPRHQFPPLRSIIAQAFILAYKEDTSPIEQALREEGFSPRVLRPTYTQKELSYSRTIRCLLNHDSAWTLARAIGGLTLVMEADFVPCEGFGSLPLPFDPATRGNTAWAFLYAGGPRIFDVLSDGSLPGHAACPVAYVISPRIGAWLNEYTRDELVRHGNLTQYSLWDTQFQWRLMGKGATCFMPWRHNGEHGGLPNREHDSAGVGVAKRFWLLGRLGLGKNHHADVLYAPLKFLPPYAQGSRCRLWRTRLEAKLTGWLKLLSGKMVQPLGHMSFGQKAHLYYVCATRLCGLN
jgi:hypothetical protein